MTPARRTSRCSPRFHVPTSAAWPAAGTARTAVRAARKARTRRRGIVVASAWGRSVLSRTVRPTGLQSKGMTLADSVKQDLTTAMKAGDKTRVGALRLLLSELQKDAKEGPGDEVAVLRRERKRRLDAASQF